jgi:tripartite-type tricarboxylate transporter receptor subunit TctC
MSSRRGFLASTIGLTGLALTAPRSLRAQERFPDRPIRVLVPYAPGGATDIVARVVGQEMQRALGQAVVIENKPGAAGILAIEQMARSRPDGYTVMIGNVSTNGITPVLFQNRMSIDYARDVVPVARLADLPAFVLATGTNFAPRTLPEFIAYAKAHPGKVNYCSAGVGSYPQFDAVMLERRAGLEMVHVPFPGGAAPILTEMISGNLQFCFLNTASSGGLVKDGRLRALAVVSDTRLPDYPDVPTMAELGFGGIGTTAWQAMFAPAGTPPDVLATLNKAAFDALRSETVQEAFRRQALRSLPPTSLEDMKTWLDRELASWKAIVADAKIDVS